MFIFRPLKQARTFRCSVTLAGSYGIARPTAGNLNRLKTVNPSTKPAGTQYGPCKPLVLEFDRENLSGKITAHTPAWADGTYFTDHSYRGFAADGVNGELLLLNINAKTSEQFVSYRDSSGQWHQKGTIEFPIRSAYPQVSLRDGSAHVMAIGDIVEPVEQWRKLKFEKTNRKWDYVFRRLFYTYTDNIRTTGFRAPVEIDTVEETGGYIRNLDMHIDAAGAAHLLYTKQPHQYAFIRDKYFPGQAMTINLEYVVVKDGKVVSKRTLAQSSQDSAGFRPSFARFHISSDGKIHVIAAGTGIDKGKRAFGNYIGKIPAGKGRPVFERIGLKHPFGSFFTNTPRGGSKPSDVIDTPRGGSKPSDVIDIFGIADDNPNLRYARVRVAPPGD